MARASFLFLLGLPILWTSLGFTSPAQAQPFNIPPRLNTGRYGMPAVVIGTDIYVIGGASASGVRSDIEQIATQNRNLKVSEIPTKLLPRTFHTAQAEGPYIYVMGGMIRDENNEIHYPLQVERLDTRDGHIELMAPLPIGLRTPASALVGKKIYLAGGSLENGDWTDNLLIYDIETNTWEKGAPMPENKECDLLPWHHGLLALGGFNGEKSVTGVQFYDIATDTWSVLSPLPVPTSAHHGAVLKTEDGNEHVVLFGDYSEMGRVQIGEPETGHWTKLGMTNFTGRRHMAVITIGPKIYVIGGNIASLGSYLEDIEVFEAEGLASPP